MSLSLPLSLSIVSLSFCQSRLVHMVFGVKIYAKVNRSGTREGFPLPAEPAKQPQAPHPGLQEGHLLHRQKVTLNTPWPGHLDKCWCQIVPPHTSRRAHVSCLDWKKACFMLEFSLVWSFLILYHPNWNIGYIGKRVISKMTLLTTPELFSGLIQSIWYKNGRLFKKLLFWPQNQFFSRYAPITYFFGLRLYQLNGIISSPCSEVTLDTFGFPVGAVRLLSGLFSGTDYPKWPFLDPKSVFLCYAPITHFFGLKPTQLNGIITSSCPEATPDTFSFLTIKSDRGQHSHFLRCFSTYCPIFWIFIILSNLSYLYKRLGALGKKAHVVEIQIYFIPPPSLQ